MKIMRCVLFFAAVSLLEGPLAFAEDSIRVPALESTRTKVATIAPLIRVRSAQPTPDSQTADISLFELLSDESQKKLGQDADLRSVLSRFTVSHRPAAGEIITLSGSTLQSLFEQAIRLWSDREVIELRVASRIQIQSLPLISVSELQDRIQAQVELGCRPCRVSLSQVRVPPIEFDQVQSVQGLDHVLNLRGTFSHPIDLSFRDGSSKRVFVTGRAEIDQEVLLLKKPVAAGEKVSDSHLQTAERRTTYVRNPMTKREDLEDLVYTRPVGAGELLQRDAVKRETVIRNGENVRVRFVTPTFEIATEGIALGQGSIGERVQVKVGATGKQLTAIVRGKGYVEIQ